MLGLAEIVLSSIFWLGEPRVHKLPYIFLESNCPATEQIKPKLPGYTIENLIAEAPYSVSVENDSAIATWHFSLRFYSPNLKYEERILSSEGGINDLIAKENVGIIEFYEKDSSGQPFNNPSAKIFLDIKVYGKNLTYTVLSLSGLKHTQEIPKEFCEEVPERGEVIKGIFGKIEDAGKYIFGLRMWDAFQEMPMERFMPLPSPIPQLPPHSLVRQIKETDICRPILESLEGTRFEPICYHSGIEKLAKGKAVLFIYETGETPEGERSNAVAAALSMAVKGLSSQSTKFFSADASYNAVKAFRESYKIEQIPFVGVFWDGKLILNTTPQAPSSNKAAQEAQSEFMRRNFQAYLRRFQAY